MLSLQGIPGIYFNSLIAAPNWLAGIEKTGQARTINRQKWGLAELEDLLGDAVQPASRVLTEYRRLLGIRRASRSRFIPTVPSGRYSCRRGCSASSGRQLTAPSESGSWPISLPSRWKSGRRRSITTSTGGSGTSSLKVGPARASSSGRSGWHLIKSCGCRGKPHEDTYGVCFHRNGRIIHAYLMFGAARGRHAWTRRVR